MIGIEESIDENDAQPAEFLKVMSFQTREDQGGDTLIALLRVLVRKDVGVKSVQQPVLITGGSAVSPSAKTVISILVSRGGTILPLS